MTDAHAAGGNPYRIYLVTWVVLLVITVAMLLAEKFHMPPIFLILFLLAFMAVKAAMIGLNFMHLRYERANLVAIVVLGIVVTSLILWSFIAPESHSVRDKTTFPPQVPAHAEGGGHE